MEKPVAIAPEIHSLIRHVRGFKVILDSDLAAIYGVPTSRFNEAVRRNIDKFPSDFLFQLSKKEFQSLTSQFAISKTGPRRTQDPSVGFYRAWRTTSRQCIEQSSGFRCGHLCHKGFYPTA